MTKRLTLLLAVVVTACLAVGAVLAVRSPEGSDGSDGPADRDAIEINARFSPSGDAEPSTYFRIYFVEAPLGPPLLVTCDWKVDQTAAIDSACTDLVASMEVAS